MSFHEIIGDKAVTTTLFVFDGIVSIDDKALTATASS